MDVLCPVWTTAGPTRQPKTTAMMAIVRRLCTAHPPSLFPFSVSTYDISSPPPSSLRMSPLLFKHIQRVIADPSISLASVKRLFIILQFGRVQIFSLGHSLEQTAYYCWRAPATVGPSGGRRGFIITTAGLGERTEQPQEVCEKVKGVNSLLQRGPDTQTNPLTHP